jgi:hypothetical protein
VDTARTLEALEAGVVPISDLLKPAHRPPQFDYWRLCFGDDCPLPRIADWGDFPALARKEILAWPRGANTYFSWWQGWKRDISYQLHQDVRELGDHNGVTGPQSPTDLITVVIPTSPIPGHPNTADIVETVESVREQLGDCDIVIAADGVRPEQLDRTADYEEYLRRLLWLANFRWHNVWPMRLGEWGHQANTVRAALAKVRTPLVLFVEHDCPLVGDIEWAKLCAFVQSGDAHHLRLHISPEFHSDHEPLMLDHETVQRDTLAGPIPVRRTVQWWARPHLSTAAFWRSNILPHFTEESRTMIEDRLYGIAWSAWKDRGEQGWDDWRLWVYTPEGSFLRSRHLDSRKDAPKFDMKFT